ncbi:hypothetical protein [Hyphomonas sp.]|uniref:hypothetical protein n=1 Tax=Hyphomonas sp. TaxID=87 RepID=UPI0025C51800|nr:hypothetical protein [Hyphomonas sp.]
MTRISQTDQALLLLRARLQEMGRTRRAAGPVRKGTDKAAPMTARERLTALGELNGLSEEDRHRLFVRSLMTEVFGEPFANDAKFLAVADDVYAVLSTNDEGKGLLRRAIEQMLR